MAYEVLARKWRPQQFDDVVGQDHVSRTLKNALETDRVAHAYLFVGPRGTGKTSTARILAKALNCESGPTTTPCDRCDACREIMSGSSLDVLEIDGASNNGVEQVRDLRQNVQYAPARGPFKIYVIDEVHMLSTAAFNALLKTLEEPPRHVKFVFATTEPQKVPATILSRCQRFDLRRIPMRAIVDRLKHICEAEQLTVEEAALVAVARAAEGGMRDAQSSLDQLIAFRGKEIQEEDVLSVFGLVAWSALESLVSAILAGDVKTAMARVAELDESGKDLQRLVVELLEQFRNLLICVYTGGELGSSDLTDAQQASVRKAAEGLDPGRLLEGVEILTEAEGRMRHALSRRTLLETALIKAARASTLVSIDELIAQVEALQAGGTLSARPTSGTPRAVEGGAPVAEPPPSPPAEARKPARGAEQDGEDADSSVGAAGAEVDRLRNGWAEFADRVGRYVPLARSSLLNAAPVRVTETEVEIGFDPEFREQRDAVDVPRTRKAMGHVLEQMLGRGVRVCLGLLEGAEATGGLPSDHPVSEEGGEAEAPTDDAGTGSRTRTKAEWYEDPAVRKTLEMFRGDIVDIRE